MFIVLYRWRVRPGFDDQLIKAWSDVTADIVNNHNSLGSRLHKGDDGLWYAYTQWHSAEDREIAFSAMQKSEARRLMHEAVGEFLPEVILEPVSDYLVPTPI